MPLTNENIGVVCAEVDGLPSSVFVEHEKLDLKVLFTNNFWVISYVRVDSSVPVLICSHLKLSNAVEKMYDHLQTLGVAP